jgi:C-terminal processing protease CtpA/Prc
MRLYGLPLLLLGFLAGCQFDPLSEDYAQSDNLPYRILQRPDGSRQLETRIPVPSGSSTYSDPLHQLDSAPSGQSPGTWWRQDNIHASDSWGPTEEFWFGWYLLDAYQIDRQNQTSPVPLVSQGVANLFYKFHADSLHGAIYTRYIPPVNAGTLNSELNGTIQDSVLGIFFSVWPRDTLVVAQAIQGTPAGKAGLQNGDRILTFDGRPAKSALSYLTDSVGSRKIRLVYLRPGTGLDTISIGRAGAIMPTVFRDSLPGGIGYIYIGQFAPSDPVSGLASTDVQFQDAAAWVEANSKGGWILDLRDDGGGVIDVSRCIASALVPSPAKLIQITERSVDFNAANPMLDGQVSSSPMMDSSVTHRLQGRTIRILQNGYTASASELLISALRENLGSSVREYGTTTYGKGIGQLYFDTPLGGLMAVTCLHLNPVHQPSYHQIGIAADVQSTDPDSTVVFAWRDASSSSAAARNLAKTPGFQPDLSAIAWNRNEVRHLHPPAELPKRAPWKTSPIF